METYFGRIAFVIAAKVDLIKWSGERNHFCNFVAVGGDMDYKTPENAKEGCKTYSSPERRIYRTANSFL